MNHLALLNAVPPFRATLPPNLAAALAHYAEQIELKPGQEALQMKIPPPRVAFLSAGFAAYAIASSDTISDLLPTGSWVALPFLLNPDSPPPTIWAISHATLTTLPREELLRAAYATPRLALALALAAADDARIAHAHLTALRVKSAEGRCAYLLSDLANRVYGSLSFECPLDQAALAALAGLSRGTFNRTIKALADQQLIRCERNQYRLLNVDRLKDVK